jgi:hypothetical protein
MIGRTIRSSLCIFAGWCCLLSGAAIFLHSPAMAAGGPVCLYNSRSFSEGAFICVQKSVMLSCASEGARAVWRPVADQYLADRCVAATPFTQARRFVQRARPPRQQAVSTEPAAAKCFTFNGRRYCE